MPHHRECQIRNGGASDLRFLSGDRRGRSKKKNKKDEETSPDHVGAGFEGVLVHDDDEPAGPVIDTEPIT